MRKISSKKLAIITSLASFLIGTIIFVLYYLTDSDTYLFTGYFFIIAAGIFNAIILLKFLFRALNNYKNRKEHLYSALLLTANIPVLIIYVYFTTVLMNTMRVNFENDFDTTLTEIEIVGCENQQINDLDPGEKIIVWIEIPSDCSISIKYTVNGVKNSETVVSYVTSNLGHKMKHKIDGKHKDII